MRKYFGLILLGVCLLIFASVPTALAGGSTYYAGKNSQNQKLLFSVDHTSRGPMFDPVFTNVIDRCPAGGGAIRTQYIFFGFQIPIRNGKFSLVLNDLSELFRWSGTVTSKKASGTQSDAFAAFDRSGGLQDCTTGPLSWKAPALVPASSKAAAGPAGGYTVKVTKAPDGSVHFSITH